jgi:hypothetical protein
MVEDWLNRSGHERRMSLEAAHLIYTEQQEIMKGLRGEKTFEPFLY